MLFLGVIRRVLGNPTPVLVLRTAAHSNRLPSAGIGTTNLLDNIPYGLILTPRCSISLPRQGAFLLVQHVFFEPFPAHRT
jgi:hypothetical protein